MQDHYCVNFRSNDERSKSGENLSFFNFSSNDLLRSKWIVATRHDEGPDFEIRKSRVVTSALLAERIIGDRLCLSISDSANSFFFVFCFYDDELTSLLFCFLVRKFFFLLQFVLSALFTLLGPCKLR